MERVLVFVISPVATNTLIGFKAFIQVIKIFSRVGKCRPEGHKCSLGYLLVNGLCYILGLFVLF